MCKHALFPPFWTLLYLLWETSEVLIGRDEAVLFYLFRINIFSIWELENNVHNITASLRAIKGQQDTNITI